MDVEILRKRRRRLHTWGMKEGEGSGHSCYPLFSSTLSLVQSRLSSLLPSDLSLLCLSLPASASPPFSFLPLPLSPLPPPLLSLPWQKRFWFFCILLPGRSTASETLLWSPRLLSMGLSPQPQITPMSHRLNVSEAFPFFSIFCSC